MIGKKFFVLILCLVMLLSYVPLAPAAGEGNFTDYMEGIGTKFGRGLVNVVTSLAEIPCTTVEEIDAKGGATGTATGFGKGTLFMLRRILVGATEIMTFFMPMERTIPPVCQTTV